MCYASPVFCIFQNQQKVTMNICDINFAHIGFAICEFALPFLGSFFPGLDCLVQRWQSIPSLLL